MNPALFLGVTATALAVSIAWGRWRYRKAKQIARLKRMQLRNRMRSPG